MSGRDLINVVNVFNLIPGSDTAIGARHSSVTAAGNVFIVNSQVFKKGLFSIAFSTVTIFKSCQAGLAVKEVSLPINFKTEGSIF